MEIKIVGVTLAAFVSLVVLAAVLVPIVDDYDSPKSFYNDGTYRMSPVGDGTLVVSYENDVVSINGTEYNYSARPITQGTIMFYETAHSARVGYLYIYDNNGYNRANIARTDTMEITYDGSTKSCHVMTVHNGTEYNSDYTYVEEIYYADPDGAYIWSGEKPATAYIPDDWSNFNTWSDGADYFYAVIQDDIQINYADPPEGTTVTLTTSPVIGYSGVKVIDSYTLNIPESDPLDCRGYILPYKVQGINTVTDPTSGIVAIIPLLVIVAILLGVVALVIRSKSE